MPTPPTPRSPTDDSPPQSPSQLQEGYPSDLLRLRNQTIALGLNIRKSAQKLVALQRLARAVITMYPDDPIAQEQAQNYLQLAKDMKIGLIATARQTTRLLSGTQTENEILMDAPSQNFWT